MSGALLYYIPCWGTLSVYHRLCSFCWSRTIHVEDNLLINHVSCMISHLFYLNALWCFSIAESILKAVWWLRAVFCIAWGLKWGLSMLEACHTSWVKSKVTGFLKDRGSDANCHCTLQKPVHAKLGLLNVWVVCSESPKMSLLLLLLMLFINNDKCIWREGCLLVFLMDLELYPAVRM